MPRFCNECYAELEYEDDVCLSHPEAPVNTIHYPYYCGVCDAGGIRTLGTIERGGWRVCPACDAEMTEEQERFDEERQ